ncbi:MAG: sulfur carrier protein ThiS adenylyltransferase ThiF [Ruminococcus sp.]|jgi:sulfur carrier protein ThiS adenylyltransferase
MADLSLRSAVQFPSEGELDKAKDSRFSPEIHQKLKAASVGIAGLGGLGSHIAVMLARSGIGHLHLIDFDVVDISNLNRQAYTTLHLGMPKTEALTQILYEINPYMKVTSNFARVTEENAAALLGKYSIVCEAFDDPGQKSMLINTLLENCPDTTVISGSGMAGFESANTIRTRKVFNRLYLCGDGETDAYEGIGLMASRVSVCAGHQANMVIRLLLGYTEV